MGCTYSSKKTQDSIKIGAVLAQTGWASPIGLHMQRGALLALEKVNTEGGINGVPLSIIIEDWKSSNVEAATAAKKLLEVDGVKIILGQWTGDVQSYLPLIDDHNATVMCIGCGAPNFTAQSPNLFRVWPSDELEVKEVVSFANEKGYHNLAVLYTIDPWAKGLADALVKDWKNTGNPPIIIGVQPNQKDFRTEILKVMEGKADVLYLPMILTDEGLAIKQARELHLTIPLMSTSGASDPSMIAIAGDSAQGLIFPQYTPSSPEFVTGYKSRYGEDPGVYADAGYDAMMVIALALQNNPNDIQGELHKISNFPGASGSITIDKTGDRVSRDLRLMVIKEGKGVPLSD